MRAPCKMNPFKGHPPELRRLCFVEMWERFSYFGLASLLVLFMASEESSGGLGWTKERAMYVKAAYGTGIFFLSIPFSMLADRCLGAATSVLIGAIMIVLGHVTLATPLSFGFFAGLTLVAVGTSFLKPSIAGMVGNLYIGDLVEDKTAGMRLFYMSISFGGLLGPFVLGCLRGADIATPEVRWHIAFGAAAIGMLLALFLYLRLWRRLKPASMDARGNMAEVSWVLLGAIALYALLLWGTDRPLLIWLLYALLPAATCYYALRSDGRKKSLWLTMLIVSTVVSAIVGQMVSGLTLVIRDNVDQTLMGFAFPVEYFVAAFSGFIILFSLVMGKRSEGNVHRRKHGYAFSLGVLCIAISLGIIGFALAFSGGAKMSAWIMLVAYAFKAVAEILIIPEGLSLMHDISTPEDKTLNIAIWYLGAGLGVNLAKMLGLSMGAGRLEQSSFFKAEAAAVAFFALVLLIIAPWITRSVSHIKASKSVAL